jgi:hypothetical protein
MKRFILAGLSTLALATCVTPAAHAATFQAKPNQVVNLAYDGELSNQGVPGFATLITEYHDGKVTTQQVMQAAANDHFIPRTDLTNQNFANAVNLQLNNLARPR